MSAIRGNGPIGGSHSVLANSERRAHLLALQGGGQTGDALTETLITEGEAKGADATVANKRW